MDKPQTIDPTQAHEKVERGQATLVCAYSDSRHCRDLMLDGAISLTELVARLEQVDEDEELIFFCNEEDQSISSYVADEFRQRGYHNARYLEGGVENWKKTGYPLANETEPVNPAHL